MPDFSLNQIKSPDISRAPPIGQSIATILLHPAIASKPASVRELQRATGMVVVIRARRPVLISNPLQKVA